MVLRPPFESQFATPQRLCAKSLEAQFMTEEHTTYKSFEQKKYHKPMI